MPPVLLDEYRRRVDVVASRAGRAAGLAFTNSTQLGDSRVRARALGLYLPDVMLPLLAAESELAVQFYELQPGGSDSFTVEQLDNPRLAPGRYESLTLWALDQEDPFAAFVGGIERDLRNAARDTIVSNAGREGARWYRHASANACGFCRMLATRGAVYTSAKNAGEGNRYHDHCHCMAVVVRPGDTYSPMPYVAEWTKDYDAARKAGLTDPAAIATFMDNAPTGKTTLANEAKTQQSVRARGVKGGPGGSIPPEPPKRGGKGYSYHDDERQLEWEYDQAVQRIAVDPDMTLDELQARANELQDYRASRGITGRLDERAGKQFDADERVIVDRLLSEKRNVSSISETKKVQGRNLPDMFVDAELAEIKTSTSDNARSFGTRVRKVKAEQHAERTYVNATQSGIPRDELVSVMGDVVASGNARYIRVIGSEYDIDIGKW